MNEPISSFLQSRIEAGDFPSAVYLVAEKGEVVFQDALGYAVVEPDKVEARLDTIYDLASLTKVLVTGLLAVKLIQIRELWLNDQLSFFVQDFDIEDKRNIIIESLAYHTSGFPAWLPLYLLSKHPDKVNSVIAHQPLEFPIDSRVLYSDLNFIALQAVIEKITGKDLDDFAGDEIFKPLELKNTCFNPSPGLLHRIAASEIGSSFEKQMCADRGYPIADATKEFRTQIIRGKVHDGNAYFMGGVAGHAGLFATVTDVFLVAKQFLPSSTTLLNPEICELFTEDFEPELNEHRSFGFELARTVGSSAGTKMSPESFGHNGFTGTSLWIDPIKERIFVLLTNRTHNHDLPFVNINSVRRRFHDLAIDALDNKTSN